MRKIAKSVMLCEEGEIRKVVKNNGGPGVLAEGMEKVVKVMQAKGEGQALKDEGMDVKVKELDGLYRPYSIDDFTKLVRLIG